MMQPSMWTSYLSECQPQDMVKCFAEHGWHTLELSDEHGHDLLKEGNPAQVGAAFLRFALDHGVSFPQGHFYLCTKGCRAEDQNGRRSADIAPADDREFSQAMDDMKRWIDLFQALGIKAGVLHTGGATLHAAGWSDHHIFARRVQALKQICDYAKGGPTLICLENLSADCGLATVADFNRLHAAVGADNLALCLDTGHANITAVDPAAFIRQAGNRLKALHIADNLGRDDDHLLPYSGGTVRWPEVMKALREIHYDGLFNFEVPGENRCPLPIRLAKLDYARVLAEWMIREDGIN